jgi:hypothetical protein
MATVNTNVNIPISPFLDQTTGRPSQEWLLWLANPQVVSLNFANPIGPGSGGTGSNAIPANGQIPIGNGKTYTPATLTPGVGIGVTNGSGSVTLNNLGVTSFSTGSTGLAPATATTGAVSLNGVLNETHGGTNQTAYAAGDILYASSANTLSRLASPGASNASYLGTDGTGIPQWLQLGIGCFFDTTTQTAVAGTPTAITLNSTQISNLVSRGSPTSRIVIGQAGTYNVQFSIQASNSGTSVDNMTIWFRINGADVANSAGISAIPSSHGGTPGALIFGWNDFFKFATNDYFEIYWTTDNGNSSVTTYPAGVSPTHPASPGIILTVNQVLA